MEMSMKIATTFFILVTLMAVTSMATMEDDEKDCADQLTTLASCIPFVSGDSKKPTAQCCQDTQKVKSVKPKCLCILIKESTDPAMGLPINTTLALQMPTACNIDAKISDCPTLLKLSADSPDAKIFKETAKESPDATPKDSLTTPTTSSPSETTTNTPTPASKASQSTSDGSKTSLFERGSLLVMVMMIMLASISCLFVV